MLKLIKEDNLILKTISSPWEFSEDNESARQLEIDMVQAMIEHGGIGLAANQVGLDKRVFAIHLKSQVPFCMFNPEIISLDTEECLGDEGCLSFPGLFFHVKRPEHVVAEFFDRDNNQCIIRFNGIDARCVLHEFDHLNGTCFTSKVSKFKLDLAIKKQRKRNGRTK